jgi:hypothetical protein
MTGWHFHWSVAPVIFLAGVAIGVFAAVSGTAAPPPAGPAGVAAGALSADTAGSPVEVDVALPAAPVSAAAIEAGAQTAHEAAMAEIERFRRQNYEDCVAQDLIGDNCRVIFYPATPAETAQSERWQRAARPAVEAQTRWLSEYQEAEIVENSR